MSQEAATKFCFARALAYALGIVRFNVLLLIAGAALLLVDQGQHLLVALAEGVSSGDDAAWRITKFYLAVFFWAFSIWLWARTLLDVDFDDAPKCAGWLTFWRAHVPRLLGALAFAAVAWALWRTRDLVAQDLQATLTRFTWVSLALGAVFWSLVYFRRPFSRWLAAKFKSPSLQRWLHAAEITPGDAFPLKAFWQIFTGLRGVFVTLSLLAGATILVWSWRDPVQVGSHSDVIVLVLVWAGTWLPIGSFITYLANRTGIPMLALLLVAALVSSYWNDNHEIAHATQPLPVDERLSVAAAAAQWHTSQEAIDGKTPMVVVATAGGGIRAAYWTATVLGTLQDKTEDPAASTTPFDEQLFAISGVSGGSVGAAIYRAVLAARDQAGGTLACGRSVGRCAQQVLGQDLLGPGAAAFLYPDMVQRFWPRPITSTDRGRALEKGWERAFEQVTGSGLFAESLLRLNQTLPHETTTWRPWPALFLNATWVGNGRRLIASNLSLDATGTDVGVDQLRELGRDIPLSTAAHNSARFPGLSPAGMWKHDGKIAGRLVDGGYFENFGADTARDILERVKRALGGDQAFTTRIRPIVIVISSDPSLHEDPVTLIRPAPVEFAYEVRAILRGLFRTRAARGAEAVIALRRWTNDHQGVFAYLRMCESGGRSLDPPLGWVLSNAAKARIQAYLSADGQTDCSVKNTAELTQVLEALRP